MERERIARAVILRSLEEVTKVKSEFEKNYGAQLKNAWALDLLTAFTTSANSQNFEYRQRNEVQIQEYVEQTKQGIHKEIERIYMKPGINLLAKAYKQPILDVTSTYSSIVGHLKRRQEAEIDALLAYAQNYSNPEDLIKQHYETIIPFASQQAYASAKDAHISEVSTLLTHSRKVAELLSKVMNEKKYLVIRGKVKDRIRKEIEGLKFTIKADPDLKQLPKDVDLIIQYLLPMYKEAENALYEKRVSSHK